MKIKPQTLVLRCYAEEDEDSCFAICLDLNLYARADNFREVRGKLNGMIKEYITEVLTEDSEYIGSLLPRPAPIFFWFKYYRAKCLIRCHIAINAAKLQPFKENLPLTLA